ncbi:MAG: VWA domain-containing protein [Acidobacteriota bacterium]
MNGSWLPVIVCCGLSFAEPQAEESGYRVSASVENVVLPVTVLDRKGEFVPGLAAENFAVFEEGRPQQIRHFSHRDIPVTIGIVVDSSGSMRSKRNDTVLAALHFLRVSNPEDEVFVVNFNESVTFGLGDAEAFTNESTRLRDALLARPCSGKTALYDALTAALKRLAGGSRDKKALILVSDGGDNASGARFEDVLELARKSDALIYTIGLFAEDDPDRNPGVLKKLAKATGAEVYLPRDTTELKGIAEHIAGDLRNQYTLVYVPAAHERTGEYRRIQVTAAAPGLGKLSVRTRPGYYTAP